MRSVICLKTVLFLTIQFSISHLFEHCLNVKHFLLTQLDPASLSQSGPGSNGNEHVFYIPLNSWSGAAPFDCHVSYPWQALERKRSYPTAAVSVFYCPSWLGCKQFYLPYSLDSKRYDQTDGLVGWLGFMAYQPF